MREKFSVCAHNFSLNNSKAAKSFTPFTPLINYHLSFINYYLFVIQVIHISEEIYYRFFINFIKL